MSEGEVVSCHGDQSDQHEGREEKGGLKSALKHILMMPCCWMPLILLVLLLLRW